MKPIGDIVATEPLEVELYCCLECRQRGIKTVGKLPQGLGSKFAAFCSGPPGADHTKKKMTLVKFREVQETSGVGFPE